MTKEQWYSDYALEGDCREARMSPSPSYRTIMPGTEIGWVCHGLLLGGRSEAGPCHYRFHSLRPRK